MVNSCVAIDCKNKVKTGSGTSFHRFPLKKPELLQKWIQAVKRKDWVSKKYSYICSEYFETSCFVVRPGKIDHCLNDNAFPTIFPTFPHYYQRTEKAKWKAPCRLKPADVFASPSKVARTLANDHGYAKVHEPEQIHKQAQVEIIKLQKKVKVLKENSLLA